MDQGTRDSLGDRLKRVEQEEAGRFANNALPLMARLDGRAFHTFTKGLRRPYDVDLSQLMIDTTKYLVEQTHAVVGYTQSDEITLAWLKPDENAEHMFGGKFQKLTSVLSSLATGYFTKYLPTRLPSKADKIPSFDCRVWNVDDERELYLNFLWRQDDAIKNSISMAAQAHFSHSSLHGVDGKSKLARLQENGTPWEALPEFFKFGTFVQRRTKLVELTDAQLDTIPVKHRPTGPVTRSFIEAFWLQPLREVPDALQRIFES